LWRLPLPRPPQLTLWHQHLASRFPHLPAPVVFVLALYSFGVLLAHTGGLSTVLLFLSKHLTQSYHALRKRLREFYLEAPAQSGGPQGQKRRDFDVAACFAPLLRWLLSLGAGRHLALAIDVTNLGDRFHVLCVSVVVRGVGIPVAWKVLPGGVKEPWHPHWQTLLGHWRAAVPADWTVLVLSDRGLESPELFRFVVGLGWHPLMRVKQGGKFRPKGWHQFAGFGACARQPGMAFAAEGRAYAGHQLPCTLLARRADGYAEPWLLLTDLPPEAASAVWYGLRAWIEHGFKVIKGGGWDGHKTRMEDAGRVERLWLVLAVATLWVVALGAEDEVRQEVEAERLRAERELTRTQEQAQARRQREALRQQRQRQGQQTRQAVRDQRRQARQQAAGPRATAPKAARRLGEKPAGVGPARAHGVAARGLATWGGRWQQGETPWPQALHPAPWPPPTHTASSLTEQDFLSQQT